MVVKIQPPAAGTENALAYNESKVTGEERILKPDEVDAYRQNHTGHIVATRNVPEDSELIEEFERLKDKNLRCKKGKAVENTTFHMSINPGANDSSMSESQLVEFADELMKELGYGDNPYRIYRHDDTGRTHYHIVSTRIGQDGKKVNDSFENRRCEKICRSLAEKYGYIYGLNDEGEKEELSEETDKDKEKTVIPAIYTSPEPEERDKPKEVKGKTYIPPYDPESAVPASDQFRLFHEETMKWNFSTPEQYAAIMRWRYNTRVEIYDDGIQYSGLGKTGVACTVPITEKELGTSSLNDMLKKCSEINMKTRKAQKERLEKLTEWAANESDSWDSFRKLMARKGVYVVLSWTEDGTPFGMTYLDRATKCAWKGSEVKNDLNWLKQTANAKGWEITRHKRHEKKISSKSKAKPDKRKKNAAYPLHELSEPSILKKLMTRRGVGNTKIGGAKSGKGKGDIKYGDEDDKNNEIII